MARTRKEKDSGIRQMRLAMATTRCKCGALAIVSKPGKYSWGEWKSHVYSHYCNDHAHLHEELKARHSD